MIPDKTLERLILYRSSLNKSLGEGINSMYSHQIAAKMDSTPAQVRRDFMEVGVTGTPRKGYVIQDLLEKIDTSLNAKNTVQMVLIGVGNLGRAILTFFAAQRPRFHIAGAFDLDPGKVGRVICGVRCHSLSELKDVVGQHAVRIGVITVPSGQAQSVADLLTEAGVRSIVNFTQTRLTVRSTIHVEYVDITLLFEKAAYYGGETR